MATLLLSTAGAALGGLLGGPLGAGLGRAAGAIAGSLIDQRLFGTTRRVEGARLDDLRIMSSTEGATIPRAWGRMRVAGQVIWATPFEEVISTQTEKTGSKGGSGGKTKVTTYSYYANFAVGLAEGPIARIGRIWADGKPFDPQGITWRFHQGGETQEADSLIVAREGAADAPAYRGLAYVVFERLPLESFGNRLPQLSFEIFRPVSRAAAAVTAVNIIPGATEFGYDPDPVTRQPSPGTTETENTHTLAGGSDWTTSLDDLQATCPGLEAASLVVSWFGNDLRCGSCAVRPGVEVTAKDTKPHVWQVAGVARADAYRVSEVDGGPAFGGTPSDGAVLRAIADLKARGLRVTFYPFILMDIAAGNALADPYGGTAGQANYPWRGRITCMPAPGQAGSPDKTVALNTQLASFIGTAAPADFSTSGGEVHYAGPAEWSYRRMILHYAHLCAAAGGVDTFLIGSELRGLTALRNGAGSYPFVAALATLAGEVAAILPAASISYAADWSEYFGHHPQDGSGDVYFNLDPLWASPAISFIGIDNYMPLSDWRDGENHLDRLAGVGAIHDSTYLRANIAGGEGFDWIYATPASRTSQARTPVTDGAYGKPWVFRYKDLKAWWSSPHFNRPAGIEQGTATAWVPQSKPIRFTEAGCPAVDKGTNQPNVFVDAKSAESALPWFSSGGRDDFLLLRYIEVMTGYWRAPGPHNPVSAVYGAPMVDAANIHFWAWDARPFPAFPALADVWSDGANYARGHWLNGRLGAAPMPELVEGICAAYGFTAADASAIAGVADGVLVEELGSARDILEPLGRAWSFDAVESEAAIRFVPRAAFPTLSLTRDDLVDPDEGPLFRLTRAEESDLPARLKLAYAESGLDYRTAVAEAQRQGARTAREAGASLPCAIEQGEAGRRAAIMLQESWAGRETMTFALPQGLARIEPGDVATLVTPAATRTIRIEEITDGESRAVRARLHDRSVFDAPPAAARSMVFDTPKLVGSPLVVAMNLPVAGANRVAEAGWIAGFSKPWPGQLNLFRKSGDAAFTLVRSIDAPAVIGELVDPLPAALPHVFDRAHRPRLRLYGGALSSVTTLEMLNGANAAAIGSSEAGWEIIQFRDAALAGPRTYELGWLLRGQSGSEPEMAAAWPAGTRFVLLGPAVVQTDETLADLGLDITWRAGPANRDHGDPSYVEFTQRAEGLGLRPWRPAHLRATRDGSDVIFTWIRRTRIDGDSWEVAEVPLGETEQSFVLDILSGSSVRRSATVAEPAYRYTLAAQLADFGSAPTAFTVRVAQVGHEFGPGASLERTMNV